jgi:probable phosphoglycerate mutase
MKIILIRHAETEWNLKGIIQGHNDSALTRRGLRETLALLDALTENQYKVDCVYTSSLGRASQMGKSVAEYFRCSLIAEAALKEQAFGKFEGMCSELLIKDYPNDYNALFRLDAEYCPPGGESLACASQRVIGFIQSLEDTSPHHQTICIVSHGHIIQGVLSIINEGSINNFPRYAQPNASYSVFELISGKFTAVRWGFATHLRHIER